MFESRIVNFIILINMICHYYKHVVMGDNENHISCSVFA